jgi:hypothetical protein
MNEQELREKSLRIAAIIGKECISYEEVTDAYSDLLNRYFEFSEKIATFIKDGKMIKEWREQL